jgi:predicted deacylase/phosphoribosylformylglycinamidine (FGAM) synthase-like amidotransferase family enzyme
MITASLDRVVKLPNHVSVKRVATLLCAFLFVASIFGAEQMVSGLLAKGTKWETPFYNLDSGKPGPTIVLTGGIHGNEPAGAGAAEQIRHWPIKRGRLIVVSHVNRPGLEKGTRYLPDEPPARRDLNRNFPKTDSDEPTRGELAQALWALVKKEKPAWLIDLHEGYDFHQLNSDSVGSSIIDTHDKAANKVVPMMLRVVNAGITEPKKKHVRLRYPVDGSLARAAHERLQASAMILETTSKEQPLSKRIRQHRLMVHTLLKHLGMAAGLANVMVPAETKALRIAVYDAGGVGGRGPRELDHIFQGMDDVLTRRVGAEDIREGTLRQFDLVIFPGGSGSKQATALELAGRESVRGFVEKGGGYMGICAGSYLAAANYKWSLAISNHKTYCETLELPNIGRKSMWFRGLSATVKMELTDEGRAILGDMKGVMDVRYHNGPVMSPMGKTGLKAFRSLATFRSEVYKYKPQKGTMVNTPAIIAGNFGKGRVLCISPHPESIPALNSMVQNAIRWAGQRKQKNGPKDRP